jgi:hypothetical protein
MIIRYRAKRRLRGRLLRADVRQSRAFYSPRGGLAYPAPVVLAAAVAVILVLASYIPVRLAVLAPLRLRVVLARPGVAVEVPQTVVASILTRGRPAVPGWVRVARLGRDYETDAQGATGQSTAAKRKTRRMYNSFSRSKGKGNHTLGSNTADCDSSCE